jgi:hypothetical protein
MMDIEKTFGFDPPSIGNRYRDHFIEDESSVGEDAPTVKPGFLCVRARDGGSNPMDYDAIKKVNFVRTREDDFDCTYRYYWFEPLTKDTTNG